MKKSAAGKRMTLPTVATSGSTQPQSSAYAAGLRTPYSAHAPAPWPFPAFQSWFRGSGRFQSRPYNVSGGFRQEVLARERACNNIGHVNADCIASPATIARGMERKTEWTAKCGRDGKGKKGKVKGKKGGKGDGAEKGKHEEFAAQPNDAGGAAEENGPVWQKGDKGKTRY